MPNDAIKFRFPFLIVNALPPARLGCLFRDRGALLLGELGGPRFATDLASVGDDTMQVLLRNNFCPDLPT